jgi:hypothetical protein
MSIKKITSEQLNLTAADIGAVAKTGDESISGVKTFTDDIVIGATDTDDSIYIKDSRTIECFGNALELISKPVYNKPMHLTINNGDTLTGMHLMNNYWDAAGYFVDFKMSYIGGTMYARTIRLEGRPANLKLGTTEEYQFGVADAPHTAISNAGFMQILGNIIAENAVQTDTIVEHTTDAGVTIDGVLLKMELSQSL